MTRDQLRAEAKSRGIKGYSSLTKAELLDRMDVRKAFSPLSTKSAPVPPSDPPSVETEAGRLLHKVLTTCIHAFPPGAVRDQALRQFYGEVNRTQGKGRTRRLRRLLTDAGLRHEASVAA